MARGPMAQDAPDQDDDQDTHDAACRMPEVGRRRFLSFTALAGIAGVGLVAGATRESLRGDDPYRVGDITGGMSLDDLVVRRRITAAEVHREEVWSEYRGREVTLITMIPEGAFRRPLPVCVVLHGRTGNAVEVTSGPMAGALDATAARRTPFAVMAVDGGDDYWHEHTPGDDSMGMLLHELPRWALRRGLGMPEAAIGISMGGFGALLYARRRRERRQPLRAVATIAPALMLGWEEMSKRNAFHDEADWASMDPLRHVDALGDLPVGIWCGTEDKFIDGARRFIDLADPEVAELSTGGHERAYFDSVMPDAVDFVGGEL